MFPLERGAIALIWLGMKAVEARFEKEGIDELPVILLKVGRGIFVSRSKTFRFSEPAKMNLLSRLKQTECISPIMV